MATLNISLPEAMKDFVESRLATGDYGNLSEYIRHLVREDQKRTARARLESLLLERLDSNDAAPMTRAEWNAIRARLAEPSATSGDNSA